MAITHLCPSSWLQLLMVQLRFITDVIFSLYLTEVDQVRSITMHHHSNESDTNERK